MRAVFALAAAIGLAPVDAGLAAPPAKPAHSPYAVEERSISEIQADLSAGRVTSEQLVRLYLARIARLDRSGPTLRSVIAVNPRALEDARRLDAERRAGRLRGPLHGVPVLIKDNIETLDPLPTTAGSLALKANLAGRDAPIVARLRAGGGVVLGKTNLSEWANIRSSRSISGWSAVGGQVKNPYALDRNPCGSSSGSGAAVAASLAAGAVGTETDGSIVCPATSNGVVGLKPTVGLLSRSRIVPISHSQDTPGPMTRTVLDAALMLDAMAGSDPATLDADRRRGGYVSALTMDALKGRRLGVLRFCEGTNPDADAVFESALSTLRAAGAELVDIKEIKGSAEVGAAEETVLMTELKADLNAYLATTPRAVKTRTLADLIAFDYAHSGQEMALFGQEDFEEAQKTTGLDDPKYRQALATSRRLSGPEGIDRLLADNSIDAIVGPTGAPAFFTDPLRAGGGYRACGTSRLPAVSGHPHLSVPMGYIHGLPVGLSFIAGAWSEPKLLGFGYAFEQRARARRAPTYAPSLLAMPDVARAMKPQG